ncbi:hypothetical protein TA3x_001848 [Tundrisphaera sp. TA3]|uniref:hypothetical protein n=1 Tax=Tundrisphaera sp. TA3 TaxID=3435775 RepID=UPI003EBE7F44
MISSRTRPSRLVVASCLAPILALAGCGPAHPGLAKVAGTVTLDGKPLPRGTIVFEAPDERPAIGQIEGGSIAEVTTYEPGDGAPQGRVKVAITANEDPPAGGSAEVANPGDRKKMPANYMSGKSLIPGRYNDPGTSGLSAEIKPGENTVRFDLSSRP